MASVVNITEELHTELKTQASSEKKKLGEYTMELIGLALKIKNLPKEKQVKIREILNGDVKN